MFFHRVFICLLLGFSILVQAGTMGFWSFLPQSEKSVSQNQLMPVGWERLSRPDRLNEIRSFPGQGLQLNGMLQSALQELPPGTRELKITLGTGRVGGFVKVYLFQYQNPGDRYFRQCGQAFELQKGDAGTHTTSLRIGMQGQRHVRFVLDGSDAVIRNLSWKTLKTEAPKVIPGILTIPCCPETPDMGAEFRPEQWGDSLILRNPFVSLSRHANILNQEEIRLKSDGRKLFVLLKMTSEPIARITQPDGPIYKDDSLELMIQPDSKINRQFHLGINARGVVFDEEKAVGQNFVSWSCRDLQTVTQRYGGNTYLAVAVPFRSVAVSPENGWLLNICRNYARTNEFSAMNQGGYFRNLFRCRLSDELRRLQVSMDKPAEGICFQASADPAEETIFSVKESGGEGAELQQLMKKGTAVLRLSSDALPKRTFRLSMKRRHQEIFAAGCSFAPRPAVSAPGVVRRSRLHYYPLQKKIAVTLQELTFGEKAAIGEIRCSINGRMLKMPPAEDDPSGLFTQCSFTAGKMREVPWTLTVFRKDGTVFEQNSGSFKGDGEFPWLNNNLGTDPVVIPPFTPLRVRKNTVSCVRRDYRLGENGLPSGIMAAGAEVLQQPIALMMLKRDGSLTEIRGSHLRMTGVQDHRIEFSARLSAPGMKGQLSAWMEYDGLIYYTLTLQPQKELPLKKLYLRLPVRNAEFFHVAGPDFRSNRLFWHTKDLPGNGVIWKSTQVPAPAGVYGNFLPSLWLGTYRNGLSFFAESDRNWINRRRTPVCQLLREQGQLSLNVNLVAGQTVLKQPMTVQFGLIATPLKPRTLTGADQAINWETSFARTLFNTGFHLRDPFISNLMLDPRNRNSYVVYSAGQEYVQGDPDFRTFANECDKALTPAYNPWEASLLPYRNGGMDYEDYASRIVIWNRYRVDFMIWKLHKILTQTPADGIYLDNSYLTFSVNPLIANGGFRRSDGFRQGRCNILMQREYLKRAAVLAYQKQGRFPRIVVHNTGSMIPACFAFADCFFDGEMDVTDYYETFSRSWNEIMLAVDWGIIPGRLSMIRKQKKDQSRPLLSVFKLYDMKLWHSHNGLDNQLYGRIRRLEAEFGTTAPDCRFYGYWQPENPVRLQSDGELLASCFQRKNQLLVYISNPTVKDGQATLHLSRPFSCTDGLTGKAVKPVIRVKAHDFQVLIIK